MHRTESDEVSGDDSAHWADACLHGDIFERRLEQPLDQPLVVVAAVMLPEVRERDRLWCRNATCVRSQDASQQIPSSAARASAEKVSSKPSTKGET